MSITHGVLDRQLALQLAYCPASVFHPWLCLQYLLPFAILRNTRAHLYPHNFQSHQSNQSHNSDLTNYIPHSLTHHITPLNPPPPQPCSLPRPVRQIPFTPRQQLPPLRRHHFQHGTSALKLGCRKTGKEALAESGNVLGEEFCVDGWG